MNYLETLKNIGKDSKKKKENLIFILVLLVILLVSINYIFKEDKIENQNTVENTTSEQTSSKNDLEEKVAQVYGMSLVLRHEVSEDNIIEEYKRLLIIAEFIQKILKKEFIK